MCIVIDTNTLGCVFKRDSAKHKEFKPVLEWIENGKGKIVFGGTRYLGELKENYITLFLQLQKAGKAVLIPSHSVDADEILVTRQLKEEDFDDQHLVSLLRVSGCKLICSLDSRAYQYFRHKTFFSSSANRPKIYSSSTNVNLLCDKHIAEICKPCSLTTKAQRAVIGKI